MRFECEITHDNDDDDGGEDDERKRHEYNIIVCERE